MGILQHRQASHRGSGPEAGSTVEVITYPVCEFFPFAPLGALGRSLAINFSPLEWRHQPQRCEILSICCSWHNRARLFYFRDTIGHAAWIWYSRLPA
ncbi:hypothetical protein BDQ94DRAFT_149669 [Aspergillus welwitschiae]|uniref:Uncharacterized protein n=1 Tax=Aspergillus welwitschiae TaxID=1341132 RepID=A0A3F3PSG5_9EURO|nr:hypothetical protein BDQ94DRAFT_149669 [Aspergillus welwitschiae]RDH29891.1 hypothetical protein BDQ94DRAFT_149669 [Aspergillus welwitschiae]